MKTNEILDRLFHQAWTRKVERDPSLQLKQGIPVISIPKKNLHQAEEDQAYAIESLVLLKQIPKDSLTYENQLNYAFLEEYYLQDTKKVDLWWADFPITPYKLYWISSYAYDLFASFSFLDRYDLERYLRLLSEYGDAIHALLEKLQGQAQRGWYLPKPALPKILSLLKYLADTIPSVLEVSQSRLQGVDSCTVSFTFSAQVNQIIENCVNAAFSELIHYVDSSEYQQYSPDQVGMGQYPGGEEAYRQLVRFHVTYDIEPEQIHKIGHEQVQQLTEKMRVVRESLGFHGSETEFMEHVREQGFLHAKSPKEVEQRYHFHLNRIEPIIRNYFHTIPQSNYQVKRLDPAFEEGVAYGYFNPPSLANPIGTYFYNGSGLETRSQLNTATLIYHELIPGHHLQIGLQHENQLLPDIRRESMDFTGYIEGWAEYGAGLPYEMGLYNNPYDWYGRLIHERFIAQRLVVDTGMNALGWSFEQAKDYMAKTTIESTQQIESEILRYSTETPAQALAYRLGYLKFMELRDKVEKSLGSQFDIKEFHDALLTPGSLPLSALEDHIEHFIRNHHSQINRS